VLFGNNGERNQSGQQQYTLQIEFHNNGGRNFVTIGPRKFSEFARA